MSAIETSENMQSIECCRPILTPESDIGRFTLMSVTKLQKSLQNVAEIYIEFYKANK